MAMLFEGTPAKPARIKILPNGKKKVTGAMFMQLVPGDIFFVKGKPSIVDKRPTYSSGAQSGTPFAIIDENGKVWYEEDLDVTFDY